MSKITLDGTQVNFLIEMLEIANGQEAMQKFAKMMENERLDTQLMSLVVNQCIKAYKERKKK